MSSAAASATPPARKKAKTTKKVVALAADADIVLKKVRELRKQTAKNIEAELSKTASAADYGSLKKEDLLEVDNLASPDVMARIEDIALRIAKQGEIRSQVNGLG